MKTKRIKGKPRIYYGWPTNEVAKMELTKVEVKPVGFTRVWAMPNHETFKIGPIASLLKRYVPKHPMNRWVDPFAGRNSPAEITNDHNPEMPTQYHREAVDFVKSLRGKFPGVLFDPPYSFRQVSDHYKVLGKKATKLDTSMQFYEKVKSAMCDKVAIGGYVISFGWNSNGFGRRRGFEIVEILLVAHGGSKNDTVVLVERKIK